MTIYTTSFKLLTPEQKTYLKLPESERKFPWIVYCGRVHYGLKKSPLANPFSLKEYTIKNSLKCYGYFATANFKAINEINRIVELCKQYPDIYLVCWCKKSFDGSEPCHTDVIKKILEVRLRNEFKKEDFGNFEFTPSTK